MIYVNEAKIEKHIQVMGSYIASAISNPDDEVCGRIACGLISDLANYLEANMTSYATEFMSYLNDILVKNEYSTETKLHAMIAVGDICLAIEEKF